MVIRAKRGAGPVGSGDQLSDGQLSRGPPARSRRFACHSSPFRPPSAACSCDIQRYVPRLMLQMAGCLITAAVPESLSECNDVNYATIGRTASYHCVANLEKGTELNPMAISRIAVTPITIDSMYAWLVRNEPVLRFSSLRISTC
jgi:hypothetical protein